MKRFSDLFSFCFDLCSECDWRFFSCFKIIFSVDSLCLQITKIMCFLIIIFFRCRRWKPRDPRRYNEIEWPSFWNIDIFHSRISLYRHYYPCLCLVLFYQGTQKLPLFGGGMWIKDFGFSDGFCEKNISNFESVQRFFTYFLRLEIFKLLVS